MTLAEAEQILGEAWHRAACDHGTDFRRHIFLFGSRDVLNAGIVSLLVRYPQPPGEPVVTFVGTMDTHMLNMYDECSDLDLSVTRGKWWR